MSIFRKIFGPPDIDGLRKTSDVRGLSRALTHKEATVRRGAVQALSSLAAPKVAETLTVALDDEDAGIRQLACQGLGRLGDKSVASRVIARLDDSSTDVRVAAVGALAALDCRDAVRPLLRANKDGHIMFAGGLEPAVVSALGNLGRSYPEDIVNALDDDKSDVRFLAKRALAALEDLPAEPLIASFLRKGKGWGDAGDLLSKRPHTRTVAPMVKALTHDDPELRAGAAHILGFVGDLLAVDALIAALRDTSADVRACAALSLGKLRDPRAVEPLCAVLEEENQVVCEEAAEALGCLRDPQAVEPLLRALEQEVAGARTPDVRLLLSVPGTSSLNEVSRCNVVRALGELGDRRAVEPLIALLPQGPAERLPAYYLVAVVTALERIGDSSIVARLISLLERYEEEASRVEEEGFAYWAKHGSSQSKHSSYRGYGVIDAAIHALVSFRNPAGLKAVTTRFGSTLSYFSGSDRDDTDEVFPVRNAAEREMKALGEAAVEPLMSAIRDDPDERARTKALDLLAEIGDVKAAFPLSNLLALPIDVSFRVKIVRVLLGSNHLADKLNADPHIVKAAKAFLRELEEADPQKQQDVIRAIVDVKYWLGYRMRPA